MKITENDEFRRLVRSLSEATAESADEVVLHALRTYERIVNHVQAGGAVRYQGSDGLSSKMHIRVRPKRSTPPPFEKV